MPQIVFIPAAGIVGWIWWNLRKRAMRLAQPVIEAVVPVDPARITLEDVSDHTLVTIELGYGLVHLVDEKRGSPLVAESTRVRVQQMARELGYRYNRSAASLRTDRTNILGVGFHDITNPYFAELLAAIEETTTAHGRSILLGTYGEDLERQDRVLNTLK
eukprot:gene22234-42481_t